MNDKLKTTLTGSLQLWHGIVGFVVMIIGVVWSMSSQVSDVKNRLALAEVVYIELKGELKSMKENTITNNPVDKQSWINFRESTVSVLATLTANQKLVLEELKAINTKIDNIRNK